MPEMQKPEKPEDKTKTQEKDLKRAFEAHVEVLKHRLGRPPTLEEVNEFVGGQDQAPSPQNSVANQMLASTSPDDQSPEQSNEPEPKILSMQCYYGYSGEGEQRKPDPFKILFYGYPAGQCYDCGRQEWMDKRPELLDALPSRPLMHDEKDIMSAIAHGVLDTDDFDVLSKHGLVPDNARQLWAQIEKLRGLVQQHEEMTKSKEDEVESIEGAQQEEETEPEIITEAQVQINPLDPDAMPGDDVFAEIVRLATAEAMNGLDDKIRNIVYQVLQEMFGDDMQDQQTDY